jgi:stage IV sporulation protein FA
LNIDDINKITHRNNYKKSNKYIRNLITRILISLIIFISIGIIIKIDIRNKDYINKYIYNDSIKFTKINNWYQNKFGKLIPKNTINTELVFKNDNIYKNNYEKYYDGIKINDLKDNPVSILYGGIVVYIGNKDNYNNTVIIQGNDGIDYWYGNIENINVNLYDYLDKDTIIGNAKDDYIYLVLEKEGKYLNYEEYLKKDKD